MNIKVLIKELINKKTLTSPIFLFSTIFLAISILLFYFISRASFGLSRYYVVAGLILVAIITTLPCKFRAPLSISFRGTVIIIMAAVFGPVVGFTVGFFLQVFYIYIGKYYYPMFIFRSLTVSNVIIGVLPAFFGFTPQNVAIMVLYFLLAMFLMTIPFRLIFQEEFILTSIPYGLLEIYLQYIVLKMYGPGIMELLLV